MHSKVSEGLVVAITSAVTKSKVNKNSQREMGPTTDPSLVVTKGRGLGPGGGWWTELGETDKDDEEEQTSSYKINKPQGWKVQPREESITRSSPRVVTAGDSTPAGETAGCGASRMATW